MEEEQKTGYKIKKFFRECVRVLKVTKKPDGNEYWSIVKVSGLGILLIGALGFIIQMIRTIII